MFVDEITIVARSGAGGASFFGGGGLGLVANGGGTAGVVNSGAGGSGAITIDTTSGSAGGAGGSGVIVVKEYIAS